MLKQTISYENFDGSNETADLYFHLSKTELIDLVDLEKRLDAWQEKVSGAPRELTTTEIRELLDIIKILIDKSYGERSADGKRFRKTPEILADFKDSPAYDAFLFSLFTNPEGAVAFMQGIVPKGLEDLVKNIDNVQLPADTSTGGELAAVEEEIPAWIREDREPTPKELQGMTKEQMQEAFRRRISQ